MGGWDGQAGPGTIAESMIRGLPMIISDYIAGQVRAFTCDTNDFGHMGLGLREKRAAVLPNLGEVLWWGVPLFWGCLCGCFPLLFSVRL